MLKIVEFLIENKLFDYSKKQMIEEVGVSKATFFKYFKKLEEEQIVNVSRVFGKTKTCRINEESPVVKKLIELGLVLARREAVKEVRHEKIKTLALART